MPFCRDCGKEVQEDWKTCPHCSISLTESSQSISIQDSAISGNVSINNPTSIYSPTTIHSTVQSELKCVSCGSKGATQIACSICRKMAHCEICVSEQNDERRNRRICKDCYDKSQEDKRKERNRKWEEDQRKREEKKKVDEEFNFYFSIFGLFIGLIFVIITILHYYSIIV